MTVKFGYVPDTVVVPAPVSVTVWSACAAVAYALASVVAAVPNPKLVLVVPTLLRSDRLLVASNAPDNDAYAFNQALPSYTFISSVVVLKYKVPATSVLPSLSLEGFDAF